jgi:hypothetical protein
MATQRDASVEHSQMFPNVYVLPDGLYKSKSDPLIQPGIAKRRTRVRPHLLLCSDIGREPSWSSTQMSQIADSESHAGLSLELSERRVEVTGSYLLINLNSLMLR